MKTCLLLFAASAAHAQVRAVQTPTPGATATVNTLSPSMQIQGSYTGSVARTSVSELGLREAVRLGVEHNLGTVGLTNAMRQARAQATIVRSSLMPNVSANLRETMQKINLRAMGVRFALAPTVVGPFNYFDLRATLTQSLFDLTNRNNYRAAKESAAAAEHMVADARDLVTFAVVGAYLQAVTAQARVEVAQAQLKTARTLLDQASQMNKEGLIATVDVNRSRVQMQTQEQRLIALDNDAAKQKLNLARMIGVDPAQPLKLTDAVSFNPPTVVPVEESVKGALASRADVRAAEAQLRAAEYTHSASKSERLPSLSVSADYGAIGVNPAQAVGTYALTGSLRIPLWNGGRTSGAIEHAAATVEQRRAELADLRGRIEQEIRTAWLDVGSAASQMRLARDNLDVARQTLDLTRQRFEAGVADTAEVVRAQESVEAAEHDVITGAFSHTLAVTALSRATGRTVVPVP